MRPPERSIRRPEQQPVPYAKAARFTGERAAGRVYGRLQAAIEARTDCDLSVYRLQLDRMSHVAVLGQLPPQDLDRRITHLLSRGQPASLPAEVLSALAQRRSEATSQAPWVERHHRPGERIPVPPGQRASSTREPETTIPLPDELAEFLKRQGDYACVTQATDRGVAYVIKAPAAEIRRMPPTVPIHIRHELYRHPQAPVVRTVITIQDEPEHPLRIETFINVAEPDQRADLAALADQDELLMLFYDEELKHRLNKRLPNAAQPDIPVILAQADQLLAAIPAGHVDFDAAKAAVMARTRL